MGFGPYDPPSAERGDYNGETVRNIPELYLMAGNGDRVKGGAAEDTVTEILVESVEEVQQRHDSFLLMYLRLLKCAGHSDRTWFSTSWDCILASIFTDITLMVLAVIEASGL